MSRLLLLPLSMMAVCTTSQEVSARISAEAHRLVLEASFPLNSPSIQYANAKMLVDTTPSSCFTPELVSIHFNVHATTETGGASLPMDYGILTQATCVESIYLTGSVPELKNWDPSRAILMSLEHYPIWSSKSVVQIPFTHLLTLTSYREDTCWSFCPVQVYLQVLRK